MNPLALQIANGNAFFVGMGMTVGAFALRLLFNGRFSTALLTITWLAGISLVILSATPISIWSYGIWLGLCVAVRIVSNIRALSRFKILAFAVFALFSLALCLAELRFHRSPSIAVSRSQSVYVIGDSISAGVGNNERTWPKVLSDISHLKVINLAQGGATVESALAQAALVTKTNSLILAEIGGNDLLGKTDSRKFHAQLDKLLSKLTNRNSQVVMFELPLLPFHNDFGKAQRVLAKKYGVTLIPKSCMTKVFGLPDGTIDGLHLSQTGHNAFAKSVYSLLDIKEGQ